MSLLRPHKLLLVIVLLAFAGLGVTAVAGATEEQEKVEVKPTAPAFKENDQLTIEAENSGNVDWTVTKETLALDSGGWQVNLKDECLPKARKPGEKCTRPLQCVKAGVLTWTVKVESAKKETHEKTIEIKCT